MPADEVDAPARRPLARSIMLGVVAAVALACATYLLIALPIYTLASFDRQGLDRPHFRTALFDIGLPAAGVAGVVFGAVVARFHRQGFAWSARQKGSLGARDDDAPIVDDWIPGR